MSNETENLVLEHLRAIRCKMDDIQHDIRDLKHSIDRIQRRLDLINTKA